MTALAINKQQQCYKFRYVPEKNEAGEPAGAK